MTAGAWSLLAMVSLGCASLCATLHASLRGASRVRAEEIAEKRGPRVSRRVDAIFRDAEGHALASALPRVLFTFLFMISLVAWSAAVRHAGQPDVTDVAIGVLSASVLTWVFAVALPMSVADHAAAGTVCRFSRLIRWTYLALTPLRRVGGFLDEVVRRLSGGGEGEGPETLHAEVLSVVQEGEREGQLDRGAGEMIEAVMELGDLTVERIMTPRTEVSALEYTDDLAAIKAFMRKAPHSRIPVYREDLDHVAGFLYAKDLLHHLSGPGSTGPFKLEPLLRPAVFVPESKTVRELLNELMENHVHVAVAADEYGGTAGIVTFEDIVEQIFGEIRDEFESHEERPAVVVDVDGGHADLDARTPVDEANDALEALGVRLPEGEDYDTVGGLVITTLGYIPEAGEAVRVGETSLVVVEALPTRVTRVRVQGTRRAKVESVEIAEPGNEEVAS